MFFFFATYVYLRGNLRVRFATQRKSLGKFNLRPLATTCHSVWPGLKNPVSTVPKKDIIILYPFLGLQSNQIATRLKSCVNKLYSCVA